MVMESSNIPEPDKQETSPAPMTPEPVALVPDTPETISPEPISPQPTVPQPVAPEPIKHKNRPGTASRWLASVFVGILALATAVNGAMLWQTNDDLKTTASDLSAVAGENTALQGSLTQQQAAADDIVADIAALELAISKIPSGTTTTGTDFTAAVRIIEPSVVFVQANDRFGAGTGSGTIIRSDGFVLTNQHVIDGATSIRVTLKTGESFSATILASNADLDVAVLKMSTTRTDLPAATLGSSAAVIVGQEIIACGFPLGEELFGNAQFGPASFNHGLVSAIRNLPSGNTENPNVRLDYIQIDADINPGNSGGGLFTLDGKLIGIPAYGFSTGINTAIPIDAALALIQSAYAK